MTRTIKVAAAQTGPVAGDRMDEMVPAAVRMLEQAAAADVAILSFSELFMAPFFPNKLRGDFDRFFVSPADPVFRKVVETAKRCGIATVIPFAERGAAGYYNSAAVCSRRGEIIGIYRKTHIPAYLPDDKPGGTGSFEKLYFAPGASLPIFTLEGLRFGIQICNDRLYPEPSRVLALKGADLIFMPICYSTYSDPTHRSAIWEVPIRARAYENGVYVVAANRVGQEGERHHLGRSMIVDPRGTILAEAGSEHEELLTCEIDIDLVVRARKLFPWWRDRRPDLYEALVSAEETRVGTDQDHGG